MVAFVWTAIAIIAIGVGLTGNLHFPVLAHTRSIVDASGTGTGFLAIAEEPIVTVGQPGANRRGGTIGVGFAKSAGHVVAGLRRDSGNARVGGLAALVQGTGHAVVAIDRRSRTAACIHALNAGRTIGVGRAGLVRGARK